MQTSQLSSRRDNTPSKTRSSCLNITAHLDHRFGGITTSLPPFCAALESTGRYDAPLAAFCLPDEGTDSSQAGHSNPIVFPLGRVKWMTNGSLKERLFAEIEKAS